MKRILIIVTICVAFIISSVNANAAMTVMSVIGSKQGDIGDNERTPQKETITILALGTDMSMETTSSIGGAGFIGKLQPGPITITKNIDFR